MIMTMMNDNARKGNLVKVEPGKAGADNASKVGAALLLAETILRTEEKCLRVIGPVLLSVSPAGIFSVWDTPTYDQGVAGAARISAMIVK